MSPPLHPPLSPIIKWSGGKRSEIPLLKPLYPSGFTRVVEPFSGGAAVSWEANPDQVVLNDVSGGLVDFYRCMKDPLRRAKMISALTQIDGLRKNITAAVKQATDAQINASFGKPSAAKTKPQVQAHVRSNAWLSAQLPTWTSLCPSPLSVHVDQDIVASVISKAVTRIPNIETTKGSVFTTTERRTHLEAALQAGVYTALRRIYNNEFAVTGEWAVAAWFAVRSLCYSGMFRYGKNGAFNVPYGGIGYNSRNFATSIAQLTHPDTVDFFARCDIHQKDFADLFAHYQSFTSTDFIFVDPPYDSAFSQYNSAEDFTAFDQKRLADTLLATKAPWMLVIKNTPFILSLYQDASLNRAVFGKSYQVNFRNRHDRGVEHLIVTNYPLPASNDITLLP